MLREYASIINDQLDSGVIEKVVELERGRLECTIYLTNASKEKKYGTSLNDCLYVGPSLNPLLYDILSRVRENRIVLVGDIEKAFLNVGVD